MNNSVRSNDPVGLTNLMVEALTEESLSRLEKLGMVKDLLAKCVTHASSCIAEESKLQTMLDSKDGSELYSIKELSAIEPRGKMKFVFRSSGLYFENIAASATSVTNTCFVKWSRIRNICLVPHTASTKKGGEDLILLNFNPPAVTGQAAAADPGAVKFGNKQIRNCLFPVSREEGADYRSVVIDGLTVCGSETRVVQELLAHCCPDCPIVKPQKEIFHAKSTQDALWTFIRCYWGTSEGCLFPLSSGILFMKPVMFVPTDDVVGITAGRGGAAQTRYIDLKIDMEGSAKGVEFTNVDRDELPPIQSYVQYYVGLRRKQEKAEAKRQATLDAAQAAAATPGFNGATPAVAVAVAVAECNDAMDSDDSSDDEDFDPDADSESGSERDSDDSGSDDDSGSEGGGGSGSDCESGSGYSTDDSAGYTDESDDEVAGKFVVNGVKVSKCIDTGNILSSRKRKRQDVQTETLSKTKSKETTGEENQHDIKSEPVTL